ncbi:hypothetical protein AMS68_003141 [Peltaster fructicola]|uniref:Uncharacterized protein n=1 Tax=Peltaster fructicola TaxID=286661 RepID=A0A6H0XSB2_9PEZI|nr:hypothetical protein AMS68_003141 [Peltaster fructicola]
MGDHYRPAISTETPSMKQAAELRKIVEARHRRLCTPGAIPLHPINGITYRENNGVFRYIFATQAGLSNLIHESANVAALWQTEQTARPSAWQPYNESHYYNTLLEFVRAPKVRVEGATLQRHVNQTIHDSYNALHGRGPPSVTPKAPDAHRPNSQPARFGLGRPKATTQEHVQPKQDITGSSHSSTLKRKADTYEVDTTVNKKQKPAVEGDPAAMRRGYENFMKECQSMALNNDGALPSWWDTRAALNEQYINAHLALGKDPPWALVEANLLNTKITTNLLDHTAEKQDDPGLAELRRALRAGRDTPVSDGANAVKAGIPLPSSNTEGDELAAVEVSADR